MKNFQIFYLYGDEEINLTDLLSKTYLKNNIFFLPKDIDINIQFGNTDSNNHRIRIAVNNVVFFYKSTQRFVDIEIDLNEYNNCLNPNNIIIFPHKKIEHDDGGITVLYNFARTLDKLGKNVRIFPSYGYIENNICNKYYTGEFDINNAVVIYCEGSSYNPLNATYVVRWLLCELGTNISLQNITTYGKNDLIYYFNSERKFYEKPEYIGTVYKTLSLLYINPIYKNKNMARSDKWCYIVRKEFLHGNTRQIIHPDDSYELTHGTSLDEYCQVYNTYKYCISYDPLTFHTIIAALCGCISIVYPKEGLTKQEWYKTTAVKEYLTLHNEELYGVAYGMDDLEWATNTIHLVENQWNNIISFYEDNHVNRFLLDIKEFDKAPNTVENNFYN